MVGFQLEFIVKLSHSLMLSYQVAAGIVIGPISLLPGIGLQYRPKINVGSLSTKLIINLFFILDPKKI